MLVVLFAAQSGGMEVCTMMRFVNSSGAIVITSEVFTTIAGAAATNCFGVRGMAMRSVSDGLVHLLRREAMGKGVLVEYKDDGSISIDLHIIVNNGVNIPALCRSIIGEVKYKVEDATGVEVKAVNVYIDSIMAD